MVPFSGQSHAEEEGSTAFRVQEQTIQHLALERGCLVVLDKVFINSHHHT